MPNQMNRTTQEKPGQKQQSTHLNDPTHRDLNAHGIQEQKGQFDADLDTFDDLSLNNYSSDESHENASNNTRKNEGAKMGRGQIPQEKSSSPNSDLDLNKK